MVDQSARAETLSKAAVRHHILEAVRSVLVRELLPALGSEKDVATVHLLLRLLDYLAEDSQANAPSLAARSGLPQSLVDDLNALTRTSAGVAERDDLVSISQVLATVSERVNRDDPSQPEALFVRKLATYEQHALNTLDARGQAGSSDTYAKGVVKIGAETAERAGIPALSEERLSAVLWSSGLFGKSAIARDLREIPGGFNKLTASFAVEHDDLREELIIRRDAAPNPTGFSVVNEFPVLSAVWQAGDVPMAEPLLVEADPAVLGSPFLIVRKVAGTTNVSQWRDDPEAGRTLAQDLARALARLHAIDVRTLLPRGETLRTVREYTAEEVDRWHQRSLRWRTRPSPAIDAGFAWMRANIPEADRKPVLVHGDVGFHNMLMDNGRLTALLDWEFSHIGDPMEDLNYCRPFVSEVCDWQTFMNAYQNAGGVSFDASSQAFFELWPSLRNGSGCDALMRTFLEHPGSDIKFAVAGTQHVRRYEIAILAFLGRQDHHQ